MAELGLEYLKGVRVSTSKHWENNWSSTLYNALGKKMHKTIGRGTQVTMIYKSPINVSKSML